MLIPRCFSPRWRVRVFGLLMACGLLSASPLQAAHPPQGSDTIRMHPEDIPFEFVPADFGFGDPLDVPAHEFTAVRLTTLPGAGTLLIDGTPVTTGTTHDWRPRPGRVWQQQESFQFVGTLACSLDGSRVVAGGSAGGAIHVSEDHGATWSSRYPFGGSGAWGALAMSGDGTRIIGSWGTSLLISDDAGLTWTARGPTVLWKGVAMSHTGLRMAAASPLGHLHISNDGGITWSVTGEYASWHEVACSSDGMRLIAAQNQGRLALSSDGGASWVMREQARKWTAVASSHDGLRLAASERDGPIWLSDDAGMTWWSSGPAESWEDVVCSSDGRFLAVADEHGMVHTSADRGHTWIPRETIRKCTSLALAANTLELWAADFLGHLLHSTPQPSALTFVPAANQFGSAHGNFSFQVVDSGPEGFDLDPTPNSFTLHVTPVDDPPVVTTPLPDQVARIGGQFEFMVKADSFTDPDPGTTLAFDASRADGGPLPAWLNFNPSSLTFSGTPASADRGNLTIRVTASDPTGRSVADDFELRVAGIPKGTGTSVTLLEETTYSFTGLDFGFSDPMDAPADALTRVRLTTLPALGTLSLNGNPVAAGDYVPFVPTPGVAWLRRSTLAGSVLAASADASHLLAMGLSSGSPSVHRSTNGGQTWQTVAYFGNSLPRPTTAAASADGIHWAVASAQGGQIHTSSDSGLTWTAREATGRWGALACSADGSRMLAVDHGETGGFPYVSTDFGATWTALTETGSRWIVGAWAAAASSADGMKLVIASSDPSPFASGLILTSADGGATWSPRSTLANWTGLASSGDGAHLAAASTSGLFLSDDGGETWRAALAEVDLTSVTSSTDGRILAATARTGRIHVSTDRGDTWAVAGETTDWSSLVSSADGQNLLAAGSIGIFSSTPSVPPLVYSPPQNGAGAPYTSLAYQVEDTGPAGLNLDPVPRVLNIHVENVNDPPVAATPLSPVIVPAGASFDYELPPAAFADPDPGDSFAYTASLRTGEPLPSWLSFDAATGRLSSAPGSSVPGQHLILFSARDQGVPPQEAHLLLDLAILSQRPLGTSQTITLPEDSRHRFTPADFGFSDPLDIPPQPFRRIQLSTAPNPGRLTIDGIALRNGEYVSMVPEPRMVWTPGATLRSWEDIDVSADGSHLAAVWGEPTSATTTDGEILLSADGGTTWSPALPGRHWSKIAISRDGTKLLASARMEPLSFSQDFGLTWKSIGPTDDWNAMAMSGDGTRLLAAPYQGMLSVSQNGGATWTRQIQDFSWTEVAMSADGSVMAAAGTTLWVSTDFGATWSQRGGPGPWHSVIVSDDGWTLFAANASRLHYSSNRGATWAPRGPSFRWWRLDSSADATRLVATHLDNDRVYVSADAGRTWTPKESSRPWTSVASSADGSFLAATEHYGLIYTSRDSVPELFYEPDANAHGAPYALFTFRVGDTGINGSDLSDPPNKITIHVLPVNDVPVVANPLPDQTATERVAFHFQIPANAFTDVDTGTVLTYAAALVDGTPWPAWLRFDPATRLFSGTPGSLDTGVLNIVVTVRDSFLEPLSVSDTFQLVVENVDDPPSGAPTSLILTEDVPYEFSTADFGFSDPLDIPPGAFGRVKIAALPEAGVLSIDGTPIAAGSFARLSSSPVASVWSLRSPPGNWWALASSADGTRLAAVENDGRIHISANSGVSWVARGLHQNWYAITSSFDGQHLAAVVQSGQIHTSDDAGETWVPRASARAWRAITSSSNGSRLAAIESPGQIHTSTDFGATWTPRESSRQWHAIASSADGMRLAAVVQNGTIFTSDDAGETWVPRETIRHWRDIASSADGHRLAAIEQNGRIHTSHDAGITWNAREMPRDWSSIASSADGTRLVAAVSDGRIYHSMDGGSTWRARAFKGFWRAVVSSADGERLFAVVPGKRIYTSAVEPAQSLVYTPEPNASGSPFASFAFQVEDDGASMANLDLTPDTLTLHVDESNDAPTIDPIDDPPLTPAEAGAQSLVLTGLSAGGGESQVLTLSAVSSHPALLPHPLVDYTSPDAHAVLRYTPAPNAAGLVVVTVRVRDTGGTAHGGIDETIRQFTVSLTTPFQRWALHHGLPTDPAAQAGENFFAFAFGLAPGSTERTPIVVTDGLIQRRGLPTLVSAGPSPAPPFSVLYGRRKNSGLDLRVEFSSDLADWQPPLTPPTPAGQDAVIEAFSVPFPDHLDNGRVPRFFRIQLIGP